MEDLDRLLLQLRHPGANMRESAALELALMGDARALTPLLDALNDRDPDVRRTVIQALAGIQTPEAMVGIFALLQDSDPQVVQAAYDAIVKYGQSAVPFLLEQLKNSDWLVRRSALEVLQSLKKYCPLEEILEQLNAPEWEIRESAARYLGGLRDDYSTIGGERDNRANAALLNLMLKDPDREVKMAACKGLGNSGDMHAVEPLLLMLRQSEDEILQMAAAEGLALLGGMVSSALIRQSLQDHRPKVRALGAQILGHVRAESALAPLMELLHDEDKAVRLAAALALSQIQPEEALWVLLYHVFLHEPEISPEAVIELGQREDRRAIPYLLDEIVRVPASTWQDRIIIALGELGDMETILPLAAYLRAEEPEIRTAAAQALGRIGHLLALDYLQICLGDSDAQVLLQVLDSLQRLEPAQEIWVLLLSALSPDFEERLEALQSLPETLDERLKLFLINRLHQEDHFEVKKYLLQLFQKHPEWLALHDWLADLVACENLEMRQAYLKIINLYPDPEPEPCLKVLLGLIEDREESIRQAACEIIPRFGTLAVEPLLEKMAHEIWFVRTSAIQTLGKIGDIEALKPLLTALEDRDRDVRKEAVLALGKIGDMQAVEPLVFALENGFRDVRAAAAQALGELGDLYATEGLQIALVEDEAQEVRAAAALSLAHLGDTGNLEDLLEALKDDDDEHVRASVATALGILSDSRALKGLCRALEDESLEVGLAAIKALGLLAHPDSLTPLLETLEFGTRDLRAATAEALGCLGLSEAIPALAEALNDEAQAVRLSAAAALGQIRDLSALEPLLNNLNISDPQLAEVTVQALINLGSEAIQHLLEQVNTLTPEVIPQLIACLEPYIGSFDPLPVMEKWQTLPLEIQIKALKKLVVWQDNRLIPPLISQLHRSENFDFRSMIFEVLKHLHSYSELEDLLQNWDQDIRSLTVKSLAHMGEKGLLSLLKAFDSSDESLRLLILQISAEILDPRILALLHKSLYLPHLGLLQATVQALFSHGESAVPILREALDHPERSIRQMAARSLLKLEPENPIWLYLVGMNSQSQEQRVRSSLSLQEFLLPESVSALLRAISDESKQVRKQAILSLGQLKAKQSHALILEALKDWHRDVREAAVEALGNLQDQNDTEKLKEMLQDPDIRVRQACLRALAQFHEFDPIHETLSDPYPEVRQAALEVLGTYQRQESSPQILELLMKDSESSVRAQAASSLGIFASGKNSEALIQALEDPALEVRWAATEALGSLKDPQAIEPLMQILTASSEDYLVDIRLQQLAITALGKMRAQKSLPIIIKLAHSPSWGDSELRGLALAALIEIDPNQADLVIQELLQSSDSQALTVAQKAFQTLKNSEYVKA